MLVKRYIRECDGNSRKDGKPSKGRPIGLVLTDGERTSVVICNKTDQFDRKAANSMALDRLINNTELKIPKRWVRLDSGKTPFVLLENLVEFHIVQARLDATKSLDNVSKEK